VKLLADQDVYDVTIKWLRGKGHDVVTAKELGLERASDEELLRKAKERGRIMLTRDKGFGALVFLKPEKAPGVILVRGSPGTIEEVHRELSGSLKNTRRKFCVVEPGRHRIRRWPRR
jgi:predicted nuclease of predicted toxin-antitoxin system